MKGLAEKAGIEIVVGNENQIENTKTDASDPDLSLIAKKNRTDDALRFLEEMG